LLVLVSGAIILLTGCAANQKAMYKPIIDHSVPNEASAYLFSAGDVLYLNRDYASSTELYRMALRYDPGSFTIKRNILNTLFIRVVNNQLSPDDFAAHADSLIDTIHLDGQMLEQIYNVYVQTGRLSQAKELLEAYIHIYPSARAYTSLYYLESKLQNKQRKVLLEKARKLGETDPDFLISLGMLYVAFDQAKAESVWQQARQYDTENKAITHLWSLYSANKKWKKLAELFASTAVSAEAQTDLLTYALTENDFAGIVSIGDQIIATNLSSDLLALLQSAWYNDNPAAFEKAATTLDKLKPTQGETQLYSLYAAVWHLNHNNPERAITYIEKLDGKAALDDLMQLYRAYGSVISAPTDSVQAVVRLQNLHQIAQNSSTLALPVKNYLAVMTDSLSINPEHHPSDSLAYPLVKWFFDQDRKTYDGYMWLGQHYSDTGQDALLPPLLLEALDSYTQDAALLNWLGYFYVLKGQHLPEAEALIRRALQAAPDNAFYLDSLAWLYYTKGDFPTALQTMEIPMKLEKLPAEIAWHIASIYFALGDKTNTAKYLLKVLEADDDAASVNKAIELLKEIQR
jgi:tetratricopeptide (TPR) repeat protein